MKTEVYTCDICKTSKSKEDLSQFQIQTRGITISTNKFHAPVNFDVCKDCLKKHGFVVAPYESEVTDDEAAKRNAKTLEDKLLDILEDLNVAFNE